MQKTLALFVLTGISSMAAVPSHAQQSNPDVNPTTQKPVRVLTEDQIQTYWLYAQDRLNKNDFRTGMATLYFLVNAQGLTDEMRETADTALLQAIKRQDELKRGIQSGAEVKSSVASPVLVQPQVPTVILEEVSSTTVKVPGESPDSGSNPPTLQVTISAEGQDKQEDDTNDETQQVTDDPAQSSDVDEGTTNNAAPVSAQSNEGETDAVDPDPGGESASVVDESPPVTPELKPQDSEAPVAADVSVVVETSGNSDDSGFTANTEFAVELGFSREDTNNSFADDAESRSSDSAADLSISLDHEFNPMLVGVLELSFPISEAESTIATDEIYLKYLYAADTYSGDVILGTQSISEARGWMFDSTLDFISTSFSAERWDLTFGVGTETQNSFWADFFEPEDPIYRWIGTYSHQVGESHRLSLFLTGLKDGSADLDDIEADNVWIGARAEGALWKADESRLDYWIDVSSVSGDEKIFETSVDAAGVSTQLLQTETSVGGWAYDIGATWLAGLPGSPEFTLAIAGTSEDSDLSDSKDGSYRQTGLHSNSADFGSASGLSSYGLTLEPELSNLQVRTAAVTFPLLSSSYLSFLYHKYQQLSATTELRDSSLDIVLTGLSKDVGQALDMVIAYEEPEAWSVSLSAGFFEAGKGAVQSDASAYYGLVDFSYAF